MRMLSCFALQQLNSFPTYHVTRHLHQWNRCAIGRLVRTNRRLAYDPRGFGASARARNLHPLNKGISRCNWVRCRKYGARTCYSAGREPCSRFLIKPVVIVRASARHKIDRSRNRFLLAHKFMDVDFSWRTIIYTRIFAAAWSVFFFFFFLFIFWKQGRGECLENIVFRDSAAPFYYEKHGKYMWNACLYILCLCVYVSAIK